MVKDHQAHILYLRLVIWPGFALQWVELGHLIMGHIYKNQNSTQIGLHY